MSSPAGDEVTTPNRDVAESAGVSNAYESSGAARNERIHQLEAEVDRLRNRYQLAQRARYRRLAISLGIIGTGTLVAGWYLPNSQTVLFALGGTGVFAAVLLYFLSPENLVPATAGEYVYTALAANHLAIIGELGLQQQAIYIPRSGAEAPNVSMFVPQHPDFEIPPDEELSSVFVVTDNDRMRGLSLRPSAHDLVGQFESTTAGGLSGEPDSLVDRLTSGLVDNYGIVDSVMTTVNPSSGQASIGILGGSYGPVDRFDNPISSFLASGLARGLNTPVSVDVSPAEGRKYDWVVTCRWSTDASENNGPTTPP